MMLPGFGGKYGSTYQSIDDVANAKLIDNSSMRVTTNNYILSQSRIINLPQGLAGKGR